MLSYVCDGDVGNLGRKGQDDDSQLWRQNNHYAAAVPPPTMQSPKCRPDIPQVQVDDEAQCFGHVPEVSLHNASSDVLHLSPAAAAAPSC